MSRTLAVPALVAIATVCWYLVDHGGFASASSAATPAQVTSWITQANQVLVSHGTPASALNDPDVELIIQHESSNNPNATNTFDSNAASGNPSKGLMQTTESTFRTYSLPGHGDIYNPVDNIIAGTRYAIARYGSLNSVPGVRAVHSGGQYVGY